ncbi:MAG: proline--tRNA ligase [Ignavibacteria bacterium]|nr:proline--tRNA ligase [Ignavibacteria bacterium]
MKLSNFFIPTLKETPSDAVIPSHVLMLRAGMIKQLTAGVYSYLPLGLRVFRKIEGIVREEMNRIGCNEFLLPALSPNELWQESGRLDFYGDDIFRIKNRELVLAPTHEEVFTSIAKPSLVSYRNLPQMWYQIQTKFRNEPRPRGGVLRARQFTMKDAYSFDSSWEGLDRSYNLQREAYIRIFTRCGLKFFSVTAFNGGMGGNESEEFMVESQFGEDMVMISEDGSYAANIEVAVSESVHVARVGSNLMHEKFHTPGVKSIEELAEFLGITDKSRLAKSRMFVVPPSGEAEKEKYVLTLVCGDDEVNEAKLFNIFPNIRPAHPDELKSITGADAGSIGPLGLKSSDVIITADIRLKDADELISGANENDYHIRNIDLKRDVDGIRYEDIRVVKHGEKTIDGKSTLRESRAIEVGHIFKLGTVFAERLGAYFLDEKGEQHPLIMGSYGIGIERIAAAFIEQNHDKDGITWSGEISPFLINLISVNPRSEKVKAESDRVYSELLSGGYEVLYDDREDVSPGVKFKDADLIGIPLHIIVSEKNLQNNEIEVKFRKNGQREKLNSDEIINRLPNFLKNI